MFVVVASALKVFGGGGGAGVDLQFFVDSVEVSADGQRTDMKFFPYFRVAQSAADKFEDL